MTVVTPAATAGACQISADERPPDGSTKASFVKWSVPELSETVATDAAGDFAVVSAADTTRRSPAFVGVSETAKDVPLLVDAADLSWTMLCPTLGVSG